ncbi:MAG: HNH endonuclease [Opitutales bacterium]
MVDTTQGRILVLNRVWQAVNIVGIKRGFSLLLQDHARVIHTRDGSFQVLNAEDWLTLSQADPPTGKTPAISTVRLRIRIPSVLLLRSYDRLPVQEVKFNRETVFQRDRYRCQYCERQYPSSELNLDHVIPRDHGGRTTWENIVTACLRCNTRKRNRLPHEAGMRLKRKPERPKWRPFVSSIRDEDMEDGWHYFLNATQAS